MSFVADWVERGLGARLRDSAELATYRFVIENAPEASRDLAVSEGALHIDSPSGREADVTFRCDVETFIFLAYTRLTIDAATSTESKRVNKFSARP